MTAQADDRIQESPRGAFLRYAREGVLAYQVVSSTGAPVFYPRLLQPETGATDLEWRVSAGVGTVYAATTVRPRGAAAHNVSMIELDEGFRLMSTVVDVDPDDVTVGQRVRVRIEPVDDGGDPLPVFELMGEQ